ADPSGRVRVSLRGVARSLLVAAQDVSDAGVQERVVGRQDRAAGDAEDDIDALALEGLEHRLGAGDLHRDGTSSRYSTGPLGTRLVSISSLLARVRQARSNSQGVQSRLRVWRGSAPDSKGFASRWITSPAKWRSNRDRR